MGRKIIRICSKNMNIEKEFINKLIPKMENLHKEITNNKEKIKIEYITECENKRKIYKIIKRKKKIRYFKGFTTKGVHKR